MKLQTSSLVLVATAAYAQIPDHPWIPGGASDFRGPCPMMNTLANHGFLPRDGRNITKYNAIQALGNGLNFGEELAGIMWEQAIIANPEPNATFFTLDNLNRHNVLEHDASMSRLDAYFGNNHVFNQGVFDTTTKYWTDQNLTATMLANGKLFRQIESRATNPTYRFTTTTEAFSLGEVAAPVIVFGDHPSATVRRDLVEYFFENERLPVELGWSKPAEVVTLPFITHMSEIIANATSLFTPSDPAPAARRRRDLHGGFLAVPLY